MQPRTFPALKLEEAWHQFIPTAMTGSRLAPGMTAVELGRRLVAGTWQIVSIGHMKVDCHSTKRPGIAQSLMDSGQVEQAHSSGTVILSTNKTVALGWFCDIVDSRSLQRIAGALR